ncbi:DUF4864 domain-containing protein [Mameliella sediminis]|uniref:DUF4864 domain-containing protein n=1 Tax=Mameliella sediminis TaxID=2836866 RepID=UPI001C46B9EB|nr:DUF4864 domain-containing protein [Mameliella sediminis]MBV7396073.1 DUF4864 domain-containing protein [Mameliella sediminis]
MRKMILGLAVAASLSGAAFAQDALTPNPQIQGIIQGQIDAFLQDDFATAFDFASPGIRNVFRTPENFGAMVRNGYPMVWRPSDVRFGTLRQLDGGLWQQVLIQDESGASFIVEYRMEQVGGDWRISGVRVVPAPGVSA